MKTALELERARMRKILDGLAGKMAEADFRSVDPSGIVGEFESSGERSQLDLEIAALFTAMISWGNRKAIRSAARRLVFEEMEASPARYVREGLFEGKGRGTFAKCVYRTLDFARFQKVCRNLRAALEGKSTIEELVAGKDAAGALGVLCGILAPAGVGAPGRSPCKRMAMFLRWMTRRGAPDFGIWKSRGEADLLAVMDVHVNRQTMPMRACRAPSWKGCLELTEIFKSWDPADPLKYDVALMMLADSRPDDGKEPA